MSILNYILEGLKKNRRETLIVRDYYSFPLKDNIYKVEDCYKNFAILKALYMNKLVLAKTRNLAENQKIEVKNGVFKYHRLSVSADIRTYGENIHEHNFTMELRSDYILKYPLNNYEEYARLSENVLDREFFSLMQNLHNNRNIIYLADDRYFKDNVKRAYIAKQLRELYPSVIAFEYSKFEYDKKNKRTVKCYFSEEDIHASKYTVLEIDSTAHIFHNVIFSNGPSPEEALDKLLKLDSKNDDFYNIISNQIGKDGINLNQDGTYNFFYRELLKSLVKQEDDAHALFLYGKHYHNINYIKKSADLGFAPAICRMGVCYYNYEGVSERDYKKAYSYFKQAALKNYSFAFFMLGECYKEGNGIKKNLQLAGDCYKKSIEVEELKYGISEADRQLDKLYVDHKWDREKYDSTMSKVFNGNDGSKINNEFANNKKVVQEHKIKYISLLSDGLLDEAALNLRKIIEIIVGDFILLYSPSNSIDTVYEKINVLQSKEIIDEHESKILHRLRILGNRGAHNGEKLEASELEQAIPLIDDIMDSYLAS